LTKKTDVSLENLYKLCGIVAARTLSENVMGSGRSQLPHRLASSVFKHVLSLNVNYHDFERDDPSFYKSTVRFILDNEVEFLDLRFCEDLLTMDNKFVSSICIDPKSPHYYAKRTRGREGLSEDQMEQIQRVTDENKKVYVQEQAKYRLRGAMLPYLDAFREGFLMAIPEEDVALLLPDELVNVICASVKIDVEDMKRNCNFETCSSSLREWFWETMNSFSETERRKFMLFATGNICPPRGGFEKLKPKLSICVEDYSRTSYLPTASTCSNRVRLPRYNSFDELFSKLLLAINEGCDYFGNC